MHEYCNSTNWSGWLTAFITLIIGIIAGYIAWQQWRTNREKLRLDLYQKRFSVYESTLAYYQFVIAQDGFTKEEQDKIDINFIKSFRESQFLFSLEDGIFTLLEEIWKKASIVRGYKNLAEAYRSGDPEDLRQKGNEHIAALKFLNESIPKLELKLKKYLDFHRVS